MKRKGKNIEDKALAGLEMRGANHPDYIVFTNAVKDERKTPNFYLSERHDVSGPNLEFANIPVS